MKSWRLSAIHASYSGRSLQAKKPTAQSKECYRTHCFFAKAENKNE